MTNIVIHCLLCLKMDFFFESYFIFFDFFLDEILIYFMFFEANTSYNCQFTCDFPKKIF